MAQPSLIIVPGLGGSGPDHWQTRWQQQWQSSRRVEQADWENPVPGEWCRVLNAAVRAAPGPVVLVAHSLGCMLVAHWAGRGAPDCVTGALLVAPADPERAGACAAIHRFAPVPRAALPFASTVVASSDDPYATLARASGFADSWHSRFVNVGALGHINAESGLGDWAMGQTLLDQLIASA